jgi:hypothetical protein
MLNGLRNLLRKRAVAGNKKRHAHDRQYHSLATAKTLGIVFKMNSGAVPKEVLRFAKYCATEHRQRCSLIGYCDAAELPPTFVGNAQCMVFTNKALSWYGRPVSEDVDRFLKNRYDIVLDCCREPNVYPLQYVVASAQAAMLVGGTLYPGCPYDLIIDAQQTCTLAEFLEQVRHYLSTIQTKS